MKTCCLKNGVKIKLKFNKRVQVNELTKDKILQIVGDFEFKKATYFGKKYTYMAMIPAGFDIECYKQYMYIWTFTIKDTTIIGYTWQEFKDMCALIKETLNLGKRLTKTVHHRKTEKHEAGVEDYYTAPWVMPVFIHNIKYEYAFMMSQINVPEDTFFYDKAKLNPLFVISENAFVFIDSYKIYPHALEDVAKMYCKTRKTHDLDYNTPRNTNDAKNISSKELDYCCNDTKILSELMTYTFNTYFLPYGRMPLTQNQIVKNILLYEYDTALLKMDKKSAEKYENEIKHLSLKQEQYDFIRSKGFRGGLCLSSEEDFIGDVIYGDETSCYFAAIMHGKYPMSKYRPVMILPKTVEKIDSLCKRFCCQMKIKFYKLVSKGNKILKYETRNAVCPWMPDGSKPRENANGRILEEDAKILRRSILTNGSGRIWKAECITTSICDIDWEIYKQAYEWERFEVLKMEYAERGDLPDYIKLTAIKLYEKKAALKKAGKTHCAEYYTAKTLVSNVFGAIVKRIDKAKVEGDEDTWYACTLDNELKPQWGVYITAFARKVLCDLILQLGHDWLYSDTDSVYFKKTERTVQLLNIYNIDMKMKNYNMCKKYNLDYELFDDLGCFDSEGIHIKRFKTIGAKAYLYITDKDEFKLVLAGIPEQFFWKAYTEKYNSVPLKDKEKEINRIFDFFEKDTPIVYTRKKMVYVKDTDDVINGMPVHCDTGCYIEEKDIIGTIGNVQARVAAEVVFTEMEDDRK